LFLSIFAGFEGEYPLVLTEKRVKWAETGGAKMIAWLLKQAPWLGWLDLNQRMPESKFPEYHFISSLQMSHNPPSVCNHCVLYFIVLSGVF